MGKKPRKRAVRLNFVRYDPWLRDAVAAYVDDALDDARYDAEADGLPYDPHLSRIRASDAFVYAPTELDGRSPILILLARQPGISEVQRDRMPRWDAESFMGVFTIRSIHPPFAEATELASGREVRLGATKPEVLAQVPLGTTLLSRVAPWDDAWYLSGLQEQVGARTAAQLEATRQRLRLSGGFNPFYPDEVGLRRGWEMQREQHAAWVELFGGDEVLCGSADEPRAAMARFGDYWMVRKAADGLSPTERYVGEHGKPPPPPRRGELPESFEGVTDLAAVFDVRAGIAMVPGYRAFRGAFEADGPVTDEQVDAVYEYLTNPSLDFEHCLRMRERWPDRADTVMRAVLLDGEFDVNRDLEAVPRRYKGSQMRRPRRPTFTVVGDEPPAGAAPLQLTQPAQDP